MEEGVDEEVEVVEATGFWVEEAVKEETPGSEVK